jgi:hypothetical protein
MSQLQIRNSLLGALITADIAPIAYENGSFDPTGLSEFLAAYYVPATSDSMGKTKASSDDEKGFLKVSVFVESNSGVYDTRQIAIIDELKKVFFFGGIIDNVQIDSVVINQTQPDGAHFRRDVYINYISYVARG